MRRTLIETAIAAGLVAAIVATGAAMVTTKHESRRLFQELELLRAEEDRLQDDWSALRIEVHTLASHSRIDEFARGDLGMVDPDARREYVELPR